jgi:ribosome-associated protein
MTDSVALEDEYLPYITPIFDRKPKGVSALHVSELTSYADMVVIVEAGSKRQTTSLAEHLLKTLRGNKIKPLGFEGVKEGEWALLDFGHIIIHVFESGAREFYDLDGLWSDATKVDLSGFITETDAEVDGDEDDYDDY